MTKTLLSTAMAAVLMAGASPELAAHERCRDQACLEQELLERVQSSDQASATSASVAAPAR